MSKNLLFFLSSVLAILGVIYVVYFTDLFSTPSMQIIYSVRPGRASTSQLSTDAAIACPVTFSFDSDYRLTSLKVVNADDYATNKYARPLWYLVSETNSVPTKWIVYGYNVRGMKPVVPNARPESLEPGVRYTLMVEAGRIKAQTNFVTREMAMTGK